MSTKPAAGQSRHASENFDLFIVHSVSWPSDHNWNFPAQNGPEFRVQVNHLKTDADERAVMAKIYLALMEKGAATDAEKQIVLAALFRSGSDGIVRDDGPPDLALQSLIAKGLGARS